MLVNKALTTLKKSFLVIKKAKKLKDDDFIMAAEDSTIQRFEYCYDSFWKFLKRYLEIRYTLEQVNNPRNTFRECVLKGVCSEDDGLILINMIGDRNETSHNYDIDEVRAILPAISGYYDCMETILKRLSTDLSRQKKSPTKKR